MFVNEDVYCLHLFSTLGRFSEVHKMVCQSALE